MHSTDTPVPEPVEKAVSLPEAIEFVLRCLKYGEFDEGEEVCRKILAVAPDYPDALHYAGVLAHENGRTDEALALIARSLERAPEQADWHSNLGVVRQATGDLDGAIAAYERAIALKPSHARAHGNLGVLLKVRGDLAGAEAAYRRSIELDAKHADAYHNLAVVLSSTNRSVEAVTAFCRALTLKPHYPEARRALALAYCTLGQFDRAVQVCEEWLKDEPESSVAIHTLAACSGRDVPLRASDDYVQKVFDSFAASFESKLARLNYRAPELVSDALVQVGVPANHALDILDVGCGTGLCGPLLAPYARSLVGMDLSVGMLKHAAEKGVYDELIQAELTEYLSRQHDRFDIIVSADTLVYFGALEAVVAAAARALRTGGVLVFTVEEEVDAALAQSYRIRPHGRYTHGPSYIDRVLVSAGLSPRIGRADLRLEAGLPVAGLVVCGIKPGDSAARGAAAVEDAQHG
jgi:predicted TPR repeat methyltransferase